jgi:dsRNA-specific ribonuclease
VLFHDEVLGSGTAGSKKEAEQRAASAALLLWEKREQL